MNYLFKLTKQRDTISGYRIQGRHGKVALGVPNKFRGDPSKWFWVGDAWKSAAIGSIVPSASEVAFNFVIVSERIWSLPESQKDACNINTEAHRRSARLFHFPRHLGISEIHFLLLQEPTPEIAMQNLGVFGLSPPRKTNEPISHCAPSAGHGGEAFTGTDSRKTRGAKRATAEHSQEAKKGGALDPCFYWEAYRGDADLQASTFDQGVVCPLRGLSGDYGCCPYRDFACNAIFRSRPGEGRVHRIRPNCPSIVVDFLASKAPREASDVPHYVNWALNNLLRAWMTNMDVVARCRSLDDVQALFPLAL
ncbi:hypothetical protein OROHE_008046 [Orobanche hederae]